MEFFLVRGFLFLDFGLVFGGGCFLLLLCFFVVGGGCFFVLVVCLLGFFKLKKPQCLFPLK